MDCWHWLGVCCVGLCGLFILAAISVALCAVRLSSIITHMEVRADD